ncbi:DUF3037 domain-containing protein [Paenibacillus kyungheensis]|uniref:DUF3037 domain-containing protein n=1 Tax=Paenibacillus kyungheensis TaxID=1452732 RepID=A0AAX3M614_9BACL|nr:DUF3037 domain-containing protein [Paenibacillus kyungheensis]WCT56901.1 DUF3037 domain-containing protein [Paenibacillus kyungheensis]
MSHLFKYSVIRYVPDEIREEFINIGIVFHSPELKHTEFKLTKNFKRVHAFDDEVDIKFLKIVLDGIKESFTKSTISGPSENELADINFLEKKTFYYANQIQFSPTNSFFTLNIEEDLNDLFKTYVYFDNKKKSRITDDEVKSLMNRILVNNNVLNELQRNIKIDIGPQEIELDYLYHSNNRTKIIKTFSFDYTEKGSTNAPSIAKEWIYNFEKIKKINNYELFGGHQEDCDLITFIYTGKSSNKNVKTAINILKEITNTVEGKERDEIIRFADNMTQEIQETR